MGNTWSQIYPPKPSYTENELSNLAGKVYVVTGSNTGVGKQLARILYSKDATVYIAARSEEKARAAIESIKEACPRSAGELIFLRLDLADLTTIKASAKKIMAKESRLHVLFNNAGVMFPPRNSKTAQDFELQLGTNNLGHFLFTKLLTPLLIETAKVEPSNTVRVVWVSSTSAERFSPKPGGISIDNLDYHEDKSSIYKYAVSKAGNYLHATEYARRHNKDGIVSVSLNPGNLDSDLGRYLSRVSMMLLRWLVLYPPIYGAYTELFAGLSPELRIESLGTSDWVIPWGRPGSIREDLMQASRPESEGGTGLGQRWWEWGENQVLPYV